MTIADWRSERRSQGHQITEKFPEHLVEQLLTTIEIVGDYPSLEMWNSIRNQAEGLRDEAERS